MPPAESSTAHRGPALCPPVDPPHARARAGASGATRLASGLMSLAETSLRLVERALWPLAPRRRPGRPERIAVLRVGLIGDSLAALPAIDAVRQRHPEAELVVLSSPGPRGRAGARELFANAPAVDRCLVWHAEEIRGLAGQWGLLRRLRAERFDRIYLLPQELTSPAIELRNLLFLRLSGAGWVRGTALSHGGWLPGPLARAHHLGARFDPEWRRLVDLVARSGAVIDRPVSDLGSDPRAREEAAALLCEQGLDRAPLLALGPGQNRLHKRWPAERFAVVARAWVDAGGRACVLGGPDEAELGDAVAAAAGPGVVNLCGRAGLSTSAELLRRCRALVSNDTGTMHLAAAVGCPTVAVFSGWDREGSWHPFGERFVALRETVECSPCFAQSCDRGGICLDRIESSRAVDALQALVGSPSLEGTLRTASETRPAESFQDRERNAGPVLPAPKRPATSDR
ncbi:glycosyltransferase family 9 protein [Engelhardtia mirabilis]